MSSTGVTNPPTAGTPPGDPSMADILASIRRILSEDEPVTVPALGAEAPASQPDSTEDVLVLDRSMMVDEPKVAHTHPPAEPPAAEKPTATAPTWQSLPNDAPGEHSASPDGTKRADPVEPQPLPDPVDNITAPHMTLPKEPPPPPAPVVVPPPLPEGVSQKSVWPPTGPALAEPVTVATAASSLVNLVRSVAAERTATISRGAISIEDVVREEVRPLLKTWLDNHLPPLVERLVQAEIERVVSRATT